MGKKFSRTAWDATRHTVPEGTRVRVVQDGVVHTGETYGTYVDWDADFTIEVPDPELPTEWGSLIEFDLPGRAEEHFQAINSDGVRWYMRNALGAVTTAHAS